jgi:hypothetical protein
MRKYLKISYILSFTILTGLFITSCSEDDYGSDANKVAPFIFDFAGSETVNFQATETYSVTPRGGSKYVWEVNGATATPVDGAPNKISVYFDQIGAAQVSVYEETANGSKSEVSMKTVNILQLCEWSIQMNDSWGDGWNGASVTIAFSGGVELAPINITLPDGASSTQTFEAPNGYDMTVTFNEGDYDNEVTYDIMDSSGAIVFSDGTSPTIGLAFSTVVTCQ